MSTGTITDFASGESEACTGICAEERALRLRTVRRFALRASVKVRFDNQLWMGEVWACEPDGAAFAIEIETSLVLKDITALARLSSQFRRPVEESDTPIEARGMKLKA